MKIVAQGNNPKPWRVTVEPNPASEREPFMWTVWEDNGKGGLESRVNGGNSTEAFAEVEGYVTATKVLEMS